MLKNWIKNVITIIGIYIFSFSLVYAQPIVKQIAVSGTSYTVKFESAKAFISRDGSEAVAIKSGTTISKPGTYFVSLYDENSKLVRIDTFTIKSKQDKDSWTITAEDQLEEVFKYAFENYKSTIVLHFKTGNYSLERMQKLVSTTIDQVTDKYPMLTTTSCSYTILGRNNPTVKIQIQYPLKVANTLKTYENKTKAKIIDIINNRVYPNQKDYEIELALYKYIVDNVKYSKTVENNQVYITSSPTTHTMFGTLIDQVAVCDGYAKSLMYLLNSCGIPTKFVAGTSEDMGHAWNIVKIQGKYYHVDVTWGDTDDEFSTSYYDYFNESDAHMKKTHMWDATKYPKVESAQHNLLFLPVNINNLYKVKNNDELISVLNEIKTKKQASVAFYNCEANGWTKEKVANYIAGALRTGIRYQTDEKYDCIVITYLAS